MKTPDLQEIEQASEASEAEQEQEAEDDQGEEEEEEEEEQEDLEGGPFCLAFMFGEQEDEDKEEEKGGQPLLARKRSKQKRKKKEEEEYDEEGGRVEEVLAVGSRGASPAEIAEANSRARQQRDPDMDLAGARRFIERYSRLESLLSDHERTRFSE